MRLRVGCELTYEVPHEAPLIIKVKLRGDSRYHRTVKERVELEPHVDLHEFKDEFGNNTWRLMAPQGEFRLVYDALADVPDEPDPVLPGVTKTARSGAARRATALHPAEPLLPV